MARIVILGAGAVGRATAVAFPNATIIERAKRPTTDVLPSRRFGAQYLYAPIPGWDLLPCRVLTHVDGKHPTRDGIRRYKAKVGRTDDGGTWGSQFIAERDVYEIRGVPPVPVEHGCNVVRVDARLRRVECDTRHAPRGPASVPYDHLISTIPLPDLLSVLDPPYPVAVESFRVEPIYLWRFDRPKTSPVAEPNIYVNYISNPAFAPYRYTDRGPDRHYESLTSRLDSQMMDAHWVLNPGKIWSHPANQLIERNLMGRGIHLLGRYGRWDQEELLHASYNRAVVLAASLLGRQNDQKFEEKEK